MTELNDLKSVSRWTLASGVYFAFGLTFFLFHYATFSIQDPDFWWHLKTGDVILQTGGLPQADPFTFTGSERVLARESVILKGYWLWQVIASGLYSAFGFNGIYLLNFAVVTAMVGVVMSAMRRQRVESWIAIPLVVLGLFVFSAFYLLERPQVVSFLFAAVLLSMLARVRDGGCLGVGLPVLMAVWSNFHGGFVVGDLILLCFAGGVVVQYRNDRGKRNRLLAWVGVGMAASVLNPNLARTAIETFRLTGNEMMSKVAEYQSVWVSFSSGHTSLLVLWVLIALYVVGCWMSGRRYWPEWLVALFLGAFSLGFIRNLGFFSMAMLPLIGFHLQHGVHRRAWRIAPVAGSLLIAAAGTWLFFQGYERWQRKAELGAVTPYYPSEAADFILGSGLQGRMFNGYNTGGYLIWRLYPDHQVFIDTRGLDVDVWRDWRTIAAASLKEMDGRKEFEVLLDRYAIDYVVQPLFYLSTGRLTSLVKFLLVKPEWIPVYLDRKTYILVRSSTRNATVIERYRMDKADFCNRLINHLGAGANSASNEDVRMLFRVGLAEMLIFVGRYTEAGEQLDAIAASAPTSPSLGVLREQLAVLSGGGR